MESVAHTVIAPNIAYPQKSVIGEYLIPLGGTSRTEIWNKQKNKNTASPAIPVIAWNFFFLSLTVLPPVSIETVPVEFPVRS
jgi:hypothetical protein